MSNLYRLLPSSIFALAKAIGTLVNFNRFYGVYRSLRSGRPVNAMGERVPWFTYSAIEYLAAFDFSNYVLFEYGSGQSTLYWAKRCKNVVSVEHDPKWFQWVRSQAPSNTLVILEPNKERYVRAIEQVNGMCDVIVIDGMWRRECVLPALQFLTPDGLVILDNSDWYPTITAQLRAYGLFEVDFSGFGSLNRFTTTTSVFFRHPISSQKGFRDPTPVGGRMGGELLENGV